MSRKFLSFIVPFFYILPLQLFAKDIFFNYHVQNVVIEGAKSYVTAVIRNETTDSVFILSNLDFYIADELAASFGWKTTEYGNIRYDKGKDTFFYNQIAQSATSKEFFHRILLVGDEERTNLFFTAPIAGQKACTLKLFYKKCKLSQLPKYIYTKKGNKGYEVIYKHPKLDEITNQQSVSDFNSARFMFDFLIKEKTKFDVKNYKLKMNVIQRNFSLEKAFKITGFKSNNYYYSKGESSWIIGREQDTYIISKQKTNVLKKIPFDVYKFIDRGGEKVYINIWSEIDKDLKDKLQKKYGKIEEHKCYHLYVPRKEAIGVIKEFIKRNYTIGMGNFQLTPAVNVKK